MLQQFYDAAPVPIQHLMTSAKGCLNNRDRYGAVYRTHRRWLVAFDRLPYEQKLYHQERALGEFITHAYEHSCFYREIYDAAGVDVSSIRDVADLAVLPTVDKEDLRAHADAVRVTAGIGRTVEAHTGGTTGKSLVVTCSVDDLQRRMAMLDHFKARVGFDNRSMRRASFTGKHMVPPRQRGGPYTRLNRPGRQLLVSAFHLNESTADSYLAELNRFRPDSLDGFPSGMLVLGRHMLARGSRLEHPLTGIFPTAESITAADRAVLEEAFGAKVYDQYASSEGAPFITECAAGGLHVEMSTGVFEYWDGEIVVTSFSTHATPLVRYRIGDRATPTVTRSCPCGNDSEMVEQIIGRNSQFLYRSDSTRVYSANLSNLFKNVPNAIVEAQLQQHEIGRVDLHVVVDHDPEDAFDDALRDEFAHKFDTESSLLIHHVDAIPAEASGKRPFVKNLIDLEQV